MAAAMLQLCYSGLICLEFHNNPCYNAPELKEGVCSLMLSFGKKPDGSHENVAFNAFRVLRQGLFGFLISGGFPAGIPPPPLR